MRRIPVSAFAALLAICPTCSVFSDELGPRSSRVTAERYAIDSARTVVSFEVRTFGVFRQRGSFAESSGSVSLDPKANAGTFDVIIDTRSIHANSEAVLQVMRGAGFLNIAQFPEIAYKAEHVVFRNDTPVRVDGELTLLGVTHPVPLTVSGYRCSQPAPAEVRRCMMDAVATFRRSDFGMTGSMPFAGNKVKLAIHAEATADPGTSE
jgi:polyisoprenoid-binding protein YceI